MARLTLKRGKQFSGSLVKFKIYINGMQYEDLASKETRTYEVDGDIKSLAITTPFYINTLVADIADGSEMEVSINGFSGLITLTDRYGTQYNCIKEKNKEQSALKTTLLIVSGIAGFLIGYFLVQLIKQYA